MRALKGPADADPVSVVEPVMSDKGWAVSAELADRANGFSHLHEAYSRSRGDYIGRVTVPVLWDTRTASIVNNESADIMRMLDADAEYTPEPLRERIDAINAYVYENVNNRVYRCGFASSQQAYERGFDHIKRHYYLSHTHLNPSGIVPRGPVLDFCVPHGRDELS